jgi:hypothetical protein
VASFEFTPTPNSTLLVYAHVQNTGHTAAQAPTLSSQGQFPQTFNRILTSPVGNGVGDAYQMQQYLWQGETGASTSFEHINLRPYGLATANAQALFYVIEIPNRLGMTLAHSSTKVADGGYSAMSTITSNPLSAAATTGRLCLALAAGSCAPGSGYTPAYYADVVNWTKMGASKYTPDPNNLYATGAMYWRNNFTGTTITVPGLGPGTLEAGVILTEWN